MHSMSSIGSKVGVELAHCRPSLTSCQKGRSSSCGWSRQRAHRFLGSAGKSTKRRRCRIVWSGCHENTEEGFVTGDGVRVGVVPRETQS